MIHTIGDSHAGGAPATKSSFDFIKEVKTNWIGPKLMYSIGKEGIDIKKLGISSGDSVIFCFGEIDCRAHIHKHSKKRNYKEIIEEIVIIFFLFLNDVRKKYKDIKICVYNVPPPVKKIDVIENQDFPFLGEDNDRKKYVNHMNYRINYYCSINDFIFFDVYDNYIDSDGFLHKELSDGSVHILEHKYVEYFIKNKLK